MGLRYKHTIVALVNFGSAKSLFLTFNLYKLKRIVGRFGEFIKAVSAPDRKKKDTRFIIQLFDQFLYLPN